MTRRRGGPALVTAAEVAKLYGVSASTVGKRLTQAVKTGRIRLAGKEIRRIGNRSARVKLYYPDEVARLVAASQFVPSRNGNANRPKVETLPPDHPTERAVLAGRRYRRYCDRLRAARREECGRPGP